MNLPKFPAADKRLEGRSLAFFQHYSFCDRAPKQANSSGGLDSIFQAAGGGQNLRPITAN
jgi:hypothetical protein